MSQSSTNPLEVVLLRIAADAPAPWYYRQFAEEARVEPEALDPILEMLFLEGLIQRAPGASSPVYGPGTVLTPFGEEVARSPELLARLSASKPLRDSDAGARVRATLGQRVVPVLTWLLMACCIGVFFAGPTWNARLSLTALSVLSGEWWKMLTTTFVHGDGLHILMNMIALYSAGRFAERTWGGWRYLLIYFLSAWAGSCLGIGLTPGYAETRHVGASGAICGIFAAEGVWAMLNARHLPKALARGLRMQFLINVALIAFISLIPGISWAAHLGGAVGGAIAALILNSQRYGRPIMRFVGLILLLPLPYLFWLGMEQARASSPQWKTIERYDYFNSPQRSAPTPGRILLLNGLIEQLEETRKDINPRWEEKPDQRDPELVEHARKLLARQLAEVQETLTRLQRSGPYYDPAIANLHQKSIEFLQAVLTWTRQADRALELGSRWTPEDEKAYQRDWKELRDRGAAFAEARTTARDKAREEARK